MAVLLLEEVSECKNYTPSTVVTHTTTQKYFVISYTAKIMESPRFRLGQASTFDLTAVTKAVTSASLKWH